MSEKIRTCDKYATTLLFQARPIVQKSLTLLRRRAEKAFQSLGELYERYFDKKLPHRLVLRAGDWDYRDRSTNCTKKKPDATAKVPARKLVPRKKGHFRIYQVRIHTATVDFSGIHNFVFIDCITLPKKTEEAMWATEVVQHDDVPQKSDTTADEYAVKRSIRHKKDYE